MTVTRTDRRLVAAVLLVLGALLVAPLLFGGTMMGGGMWGQWRGTVPGWMVLVGTLSRLVVVVMLVGAAYLLYRAVTDEDADDALEELRRAYARGQLTDEEYERRRDRLREE